VRVATPKPVTLTVPANGTATAHIPGLRPGRYALTSNGTTIGTLATGGEPGP
jgi:hypothetical protein